MIVVPLYYQPLNNRFRFAGYDRLEFALLALDNLLIDWTRSDDWLFCFHYDEK
jgi:hypothetical protein